MKYCSDCGNPIDLRIPAGDTLPRHVCPACGTIHYQNPKMVVGCIPEWEDKILLCRRAIELETPYVADSVNSEGQVIVVLGGGTYFNAVEYGGDTVSRYSLERIRYAAHLYQLTGKWILVTGGAPLGNISSEAEQMKSVLENEFRTPVKWVEGNSNNTRENAYKSYETLKKDGITHIMLVTHAGICQGR